MSSIDEASGAVGGNAEVARELSGAIAGSKETISQLADALARVGVEAKAAEANGAAEDAEQLAAQANTLADALDSLRARIEALRGLLTTGSSSLASSRPPASPPRRRIPGFNSNRVNKDAVADIRRAGYPKNAEGKTSARAFVYTTDGEQVNAEALQPYRKGEAPPQPDLKEPWASSEELTTTWHVERDAAAAIRSERLDGAAFYLNVPLCGRRAEGSEYPDPAKCYENFRHIIPKDAVAYVFVVPERGTPSQRRIVGTGEGIKE